MEKYLLLVFGLLLCALPRSTISRDASRAYNGYENRIVGGHNTTIRHYPFQALLMIFKNLEGFQCGGSIISPQYILTAAHCIPGATMITVRISSTDADFGGKQYDSIFFRAHPDYNADTSENDVAYVRTNYKMELDGIKSRAVKLAHSGDSIKPGTLLIVSGWGTNAENGTVTPNLRAVRVPVVSYEECSKAYSDVTYKMICAGRREGGKDSCQGDSGGPAVTEDGIQRGIVSFGYGCAQPGFPGVYTNVSAVREWIYNSTGV